MLDSLKVLVLRELRAVQRELEAYPDDASVWRAAPGVTNSGGTLALHLAGNVQHYFGGVLASDGYIRNRDAEFARRDVPRSELIAGIHAAIAAVERTFPRITATQLATKFPEPIAQRTVSTELFLIHLATHLSYHLGQIDYHRRIVTGDGRTVDAVSVRELPELRA